MFSASPIGGPFRTVDLNVFADQIGHGRLIARSLCHQQGIQLRWLLHGFKVEKFALRRHLAVLWGRRILIGHLRHHEFEEGIFFHFRVTLRS